MRRFFLALVILGWSPACSAFGEAEEVRACETFIQERLRSPATYQRAEVTVGTDEAISEQAFNQAYVGERPDELGKILQEQVKGHALAIRRVFIRYDAANAYGTPIRSLEMCEFLVRDGALEGKGMLESRAKSAASSAQLRALTEQLDDPELREINGRGGSSLSECCVR
jgi:hypothetical protein